MTTLEKHRHRYESLAALYEERANEAERLNDAYSAQAYRFDAEHFREQAAMIAAWQSHPARQATDKPESD